MIYTYFEIGKIIVESDQGGKARAAYGKGLLKSISMRLSQSFGRGFLVDNLENMRKFYLAYSKSETLSRKSEFPEGQLSWPHYLKLLCVRTMNRFFASKYQTVLPSKEELRKLIEEK